MTHTEEIAKRVYDAKGTQVVLENGTYEVEATEGASIHGAINVVGESRAGVTLKLSERPGANARLFMNDSPGFVGQVSKCRIQGPDTFYSGDDISAFSLGDSAGGWKLTNIDINRVNVAVRTYANKPQPVTMNHYTVDHEGIGGKFPGVGAFGVMSEAIGLVKLSNGVMKNGGAHDNYNHQVYIGPKTPLSIYQVAFCDHLDGRFVQVYDGGQIQTSSTLPIPSIWTIKKSSFGKMGSGGYAVQTNPLRKAYIQECGFKTDNVAIMLQGDLELGTNNFAGGCVGLYAFKPWGWPAKLPYKVHEYGNNWKNTGGKLASNGISVVINTTLTA